MPRQSGIDDSQKSSKSRRLSKSALFRLELLIQTLPGERQRNSSQRMDITTHVCAIVRIQLKTMKFLAVFAVVAMTLLSAAPRAAAQNTTRYDVFGGYSFLRLDSKSYGYADYSNLNGAELAGQFNVTHYLAGVADFGATFAQNQHFYTFMAGPEISINRFHGRWFGHALFGKARNGNEIPGVGSSLGRSIAVGGGYDYPFRQRFAIRVFQADYLNSSTYGATQNNVRLSAGIEFHLGKKLK